MRKKVKQYIQKSLCAILSAAMILTSLSVPEMTAYAAQPGGTEIFEETSSEEVRSEKKEETSTQETAETMPSSISKMGKDEDSLESTESETEAEEAESTETEAASETESETVVKEKTDKISFTLEKREREVTNKEGETTEETNHIVDGDFTGLEWGDGLGNWRFPSWTSIADNGVSLSDYAPHNGDGKESGDTCLGITFKSDLTESGTFSVYQTINKTLPAGTYKLTAYLKNGTSAKGFHGTAYNEENLTYASTSLDLQPTWEQLSYEFEIKSAVTGYVVGISITADASAWVCLDDVSLICTKEGSDGYTLQELKTLYDQAAALIEGKEEADFKEGYSELKSALETTKTLIDNNATDTAAISTAYAELETAVNNLKLADISAAFYYCGETGSTLGAVSWNYTGVHLEGDWSGEQWLLNAGTNWSASVCLVKESEDYPGWYRVDLKLDPSITDDGFDIYQLETIESEAKKIFSCDKEWNNTEIYNKLISGDATAYAVGKTGSDYKIIYESEENITVAMRNVTVHVYDSEGTPAIGYKESLKALNDNGEIIDLIETENASGIYYYNMEPDSENDGWYSLTFSVPAADETTGEVCGLYSKNTELGTQKPKKGQVRSSAPLHTMKSRKKICENPGKNN